MKPHTIEEDVRYVETDRMRVTHHSTYLTWFELARTALLAAAGFPYYKLEASGTLFPVIEYTCRLVNSTDYGDRVRIETRVESLRSRAVTFAYRVFRGNDLVASGTTQHVAVDETHKPHRIPQELIEALKDYVLNTESENR
jgi:acyl-CoA thioester hydrolase